MARFIAFYLPQYHPTPENDAWWGKGFTEWTNVARARRLYPGHYQPKIPADLGFYDLRLPATRQAQADLAREYGVEAFCYWHYWFGDGRRLLNLPFDEVVHTGEPDFPFCLAWANHSWAKKQFDKAGTQELLIEQTYPGDDDAVLHFQTMLPAFRDKRYVKVDGRLLFIIYNPLDNPWLVRFREIWQRLARENGLPGFFFVGKSDKGRLRDEIRAAGYDAVYNDTSLNVHHAQSMAYKILLELRARLFRYPIIFAYKEAVKHMIVSTSSDEREFPVIAPNWDHTPRSGSGGMLYKDCLPEYFRQVAIEAINAVKNKPADRQIVMIKAWNEWGEGNYMEPDLRYGRGMLEALRTAIEETK